MPAHTHTERMQGMADDLRYAFATEWLDPTSQVTWHYQLLFYPVSQEVEMVSCLSAHLFNRPHLCSSASLAALA